MLTIINKKLVLGLALITVGFLGCVQEDDGIPSDLNLPVISMSDLTIEEGDIDQTIQLELTLTGENNTNVVVKLAAISESAIADVDFVVLNGGQIIFTPEETKKIIEIKIVGDELREPKETFQVKLFNPINATIGKDLITITIEDDDNSAGGVVIPSGGYTTPLIYPGYNLVWADEFDGTELNKADWTFELGDGCPNLCGWGNDEKQFYREDNTSIVNGNLVITAKKQKFGTRDYTSSRLITKGKKQFKYGRIDIRAALPEGKGLWPALWMLGSNIDAVSWPACGEIDIMELAGDKPNRVVGTVHFGPDFSQRQYISAEKYLTGNANFQDEFHVFSLNWVADKIEFLVDNEVYHTITPASLNGVAYPFNRNFFFIFNVAVGGTFPGDPNNTTPFPQSMIVDYVRVFQ